MSLQRDIATDDGSPAAFKTALDERTRELGEAREREAATAEILRVIASSPTDTQPVFDTIVRSGLKLFPTAAIIVSLADGDQVKAVAIAAADPARAEALRSRFPFPLSRDYMHSLAILDRRVVDVPDAENAPTDLATGAKNFLASGNRAMTAMPMMRNDAAIGVLSVVRQESGPLSPEQIGLLKSFAAQAVIAIENTRLLNELRESLDQQTATSEVLGVINSSPGELQPVFEAILANAARICDAKFANLFLYAGNSFRLAAQRNAPAAYIERWIKNPVLTVGENPRNPLDRLADTKRVVDIPDLAAEPGYLDRDPRFVTLVEAAGARTHVLIPMVKDGELAGAIAVYRQEVRSFSEKQIALLENFAAQAVIAIENARLLSELRETLERQTATSEVLQVISRSPGELQPVFDTMLAKATELCEASYGAMWLWDGDGFRNAALHGALPPAYIEQWRSGALIRPGPDTPMMRVVQTQQPVQVADLRDSRAYRDQEPLVVAAADVAGVRTVISVPMFKAGEVAGAITIYRKEIRSFTDKQIALVTNFASQAVIAIENARLLSELRESLDQQTATSEVLRVISSSPGELDPVFKAMLDNATRICDAKFGNLWLAQDGGFLLAASNGVSEVNREQLQVGVVVHPGPSVPTVRATSTRQAIHIADLREDQAYLDRDQVAVIGVEILKIRTLVAVPMLKDQKAIGAFAIYRQEVRPFTDKQIELVQNFAAQAVIAIENARLLTELRETLERQTATSEVLRVISSSPGELEPVFNAMLENAVRICGGKSGTLFLSQGKDEVRAVAQFGASLGYSEDVKRRPVITLGEGALARCARTKQPVQIADVLADPAYVNDPPRLEIMKLNGARTILNVPMLKDDEVVGQIAIYRQEVRPFGQKQVELLENFAAQAVIAIENARLLTELRETLERQTATSEVLRVISSSPGDLKPVFDAMLENAVRVCGSRFGVMHVREGAGFRTVAVQGAPPAFMEARFRAGLFEPGPNTGLARAVTTRQVVHIGDIRGDDAGDDQLRMDAVNAGIRTLLVIPMLKEGEPIGVIAIYRYEVLPFNDKQIELLQNFAAQAVIAIENARLLSELRERTDDLTESLEQQTASGEILASISGSMADTQPVFDAIVRNLLRLFGTRFAVVQVLRDGIVHMPAVDGAAGIEKLISYYPRPLDDDTVGGQTMRTQQVVQYAPVIDNPAAPLATQQFAREFGFNSVIFAPMIREGRVIGAIGVSHDDPRVFSEKHIALIKAFADQAVIAVENTRLFNELRERTDDLSESLQQQIATADVLKVISRSTFDLQTVLNTLTESAARLCGAETAGITRQRGNAYYYAATFGYPSEVDQYLKSVMHEAGRGSTVGRTLLAGSTIHIHDVLSDPEYKMADVAQKTGIRTTLGVPLLREGSPIGVIVLARRDVRPFTEAQIALVSTFADQAVIAIENVRLFDEIQDKSRQLEEASKHKSQFLANMSHELRTPLNAILGYTELIVDGVYGDTPQKVQDALKRITTNGKHLLGLINDVLDLSKIEAGQLTLSLTDYSMKDVVHAVYGAVEPLAAEKKLTFKAEIAPDMAIGHGDERRLTQVLLNLVGNAIKFTDAGAVIIKAARDKDAFLVRVDDTGPGISTDDQKKLFQEFQQADSSTTKKKGGTGLGLAISKKIIEMHGGKIWLESQVGKGSTFAFTIPARAEQQARQA